MSPARRTPKGFDPGVDVGMAGRTLGLLYSAGATIGLVSMLLPHSAAADDAGLYSNIALAFAAGAGLLGLGRRTPGWLVHALLVAGTLVIARAVYLSGEEVSFYSVWFIWIGVVAAYFMRRAVAAAYIAYASAVYALTLVDEPGSSPVARWLTTVATLVVAGVLISALVARARRQTERMVAVTEVAHELARLSDPAAAGPELCEAAVRLTGATGVALLQPGEGGELHATASAGQYAPEHVGPVAVRAWTNATAVASGECVWQPVLRDDRPVAMLALAWTSESERARADADVGALLAVETAVTLERLDLLRRLELSARTDELTGLPNRRAWQEALPRELARARREGTALCVAIIDIDHFKDFNDNHGHLAGDLLLKEAAAAWSAKLRTTDLLARFGGEEFTLAIPGCGEEPAFALVERLRAAMPPGVTCSAGIALWDGSEPPAQLLDRADRALYRAKESGRDRGFLAVR